MRGTILALSVGGLALSGLPADAATFTFTFAISGQDFAGGGTFDGDLQGDGDTILNMSNLSVTYTTGGSTFTNTGNPLVPDGFWTLSGLDGFWFTELAAPGGMGVDPFFGEVAFGEPEIVFLPYDPDDFDISLAIAAIPLPASLPLALAGVVTLGWFGRRRRTERSARTGPVRSVGNCGKRLERVKGIEPSS